MLHERKIESEYGYGDSVVRRLSADLKERYPKMGVSPRQLWNMKKFYERYAEHGEKLPRSIMHRKRLSKVGIVIYCSMPSISICMGHKHWQK